MDVFAVITGSILGYFLVAFYHTLLKEKAMIEEGGEPLPTSSYVFLSLKHFVWSVVAWYGGAFVPSGWFQGNDILVVVVALGYIIASYIVATLIEVVIRTAIIYFKVRQLKKESNNKNQEA